MVNAKILSGNRFNGRPNVEIVNYGQIDRLVLPEDWHENWDVKYANIGSRSSRQFYPKDAPDVKLHLFYRGFPISAAEGASFALTLIQPPHALLPSEIKTLAVVLGQRANSDKFTILSLRTEDLNGRRVLVLEGRYKDNKLDIYEIFVDADGTGQAVQEIYLLAPKDQYLLYLQKVKALLQTIQWKDIVAGRN
jgi:hypothetical protein